VLLAFRRCGMASSTNVWKLEAMTDDVSLEVSIPQLRGLWQSRLGDSRLSFRIDSN
jgi:hypothetical protein